MLTYGNLLLKALTPEAAQALADLLHEIEQTCAWPIHVLNVIALMGQRDQTHSINAHDLQAVDKNPQVRSGSMGVNT